MFLKKSSDFFSYFVLASVCASAQPRLHPSVHPHRRDCVRLFAKPDKTRLRFVILSASRKSDAIADDADLGLARTNKLARMRQGIKYAWIHARKTLAFDCVRLLMGHKPQHNLTPLRMTKASGFCPVWQIQNSNHRYINPIWIH